MRIPKTGRKFDFLFGTYVSNIIERAFFFKAPSEPGCPIG
jgi:hypothetical protein